MATTSNKPDGLLSAPDESEPNSKRPRTDAPSEPAAASLKPQTAKALRRPMQLPKETLVDLLRLVDRDDLEGSQLVNVMFCLASEAIFTARDVPPRKIEDISVLFQGTSKLVPDGATLCYVRAKRSSADKRVSSAKEGFWRDGEAAECAEHLARVMRFSVVETIEFKDYDDRGLTSAIWNGFMDAFRDASVDLLHFESINFCSLTAADVDRLTTLQLRKKLYFCKSRLLSNHITDEFLQKLSLTRLSELEIIRSGPMDKALFEASDDGVLAFCFPQPRTERHLEVNNVVLTGAFFGNFLLNCRAPPEDRRFVRLIVRPIPSASERQIMALNPRSHVDCGGGNISFFFEGTPCPFFVARSEKPQALYCHCH